MSGFVVDASVAVKWVVDEGGSGLAAALLDHPLAAPDLLYPECANILWKKAARRELTAEEADVAAAALAVAEVEVYATRAQFAAATRIALALGHPTYDCFSLALAEALGRPLVTADERLTSMVRADPSRRFAEVVLSLAEVGTLV